MYATYEYYTAEYKGSSLSEQEFAVYAKRASAEIDHVTFGRLMSMAEEEIPDAVRDAVCDVADKIRSFELTADGGRIASESNDGYSVSYRDGGGVEARKEEIYLTIRTYLAVTGLMFRGAPCCHDIC